MLFKALQSLLLSILCTTVSAMDVVRVVDGEGTEVETSLVAADKYPQAFFNRDISAALKVLFDREQKGVYGAYYECEHAEILAKWTEVVRKKKLSSALLLSRESRAEAAQEGFKGSGVQIYRVVKPRKHLSQYKDRRFTTKNIEDMHHKILIFEQNVGDRPLVVLGSFNLTDAADKNHSEDIVILDDPNLIAYFVDELNILFDHASPFGEIAKKVSPLKIGHKDPRLKGTLPRAVFSPDIRGVVKKLISDEQEYISGAQFRFTLYDVALAWAKAKILGELVLDSQFDQDSVEALAHLRTHGISLYWIGSAYKLMHHKFLIFRKNAGGKKLLMVGSFNMTGNASENNWENVVILEEAAVIKKFEQEIEVLRKDDQLIAAKSLVYKGAPKSELSKKLNGLPM